MPPWIKKALKYTLKIIGVMIVAYLLFLIFGLIVL
jgi:hypothetical protein